MYVGRAFCRLLLAATSATALVVPAEAVSAEVQTRDDTTRDPSGSVLSQLYSRALGAADAIVASLVTRQHGTEKGLSKTGSLKIAGERARAGILAYTPKGLVMINNGKSSDWIFPRGGIDTRFDGHSFTKAAVREAYEEAGIRLKIPQGQDGHLDLHYLIKTEDGVEYWYAAPIKTLEDKWPELLQGRQKNPPLEMKREVVSYDEAWRRLHANKKVQVLMIKAMKEIRQDGLL